MPPVFRLALFAGKKLAHRNFKINPIHLEAALFARV
jgi:hypothetical protein